MEEKVYVALWQVLENVLIALTGRCWYIPLLAETLANKLQRNR